MSLDENYYTTFKKEKREISERNKDERWKAFKRDRNEC